MSRVTWIDAVSAWFVNQFAAQGASAPFIPDKASVLHEAIKEEFTLFANDIRNKLGEKLAEVHSEIQQSLSRLVVVDPSDAAPDRHATSS